MQAPLAERLRPQQLHDLVGQQHLIADRAKRTVVARALEFNIPEGHFVVATICIAAAQSIFFEFCRLRHTKSLKPDLHCMLQLVITAFDRSHVNETCCSC